MANLDLTKYGITGTVEIVHNPSYDVLFAEETKAGLEGFEKGQVTELGAVNVMTGIYTGRSPKDKFLVKDATSENTVWWTSEEYKNDNKPVTTETWNVLKELAAKELSNKKLYVVDGFCGANEATCLKVRFIMEVAWQAHFVTNMFIRPSKEQLENFEPDFVVYNASKAKVENYKELGLNSETAVVFNLTTKEQVILNTWYGGEMKKGMFSMMNYFNPLRGIASMHCSANTNMEETESAIFFGLSGTGKTTLSTDPKRKLIGDDEQAVDDGWDAREGLCRKADDLDELIAALGILHEVDGSADAEWDGQQQRQHDHEERIDDSGRHGAVVRRIMPGKQARLQVRHAHDEDIGQQRSENGEGDHGRGRDGDALDKRHRMAAVGRAARAPGARFRTFRFFHVASAFRFTAEKHRLMSRMNTNSTTPQAMRASRCRSVA